MLPVTDTDANVTDLQMGENTLDLSHNVKSGEIDVT